MNDQTDQPDQPDGSDEGPITPEVVGRRGAAARKRRPAPEPPGGAEAVHEASGHVAARRAPTGTLLRLGCMLLVALGVMQLFLGFQWALDPEAAQCRSARLAVDAANDDDDDFNDVALPDDAEDAGDVACADAVGLAGAIPDDEDDEPEGEFPASSQFRTQGLGICAIGLAQGTTGFLTLRTRRRGFRNAALASAAVGIVLPVLGIVSLLVLAFVVYALGFSRDAKAAFGGGGGFLRPRPPAPGP